MMEEVPLLSFEQSVVVLGVAEFGFFLVEIIHVELSDKSFTCLWKEVRLECLK